ncbi:MAG: S41 family peptidase [Spirochaetaceae bacterium]|jgi:carboxyl-terminal processing protease|nr:S41 family peptidase [Spirochaetaceae bacterium]
MIQLSEKKRRTLFWVLSGLILGAVFVGVSVPKAEAQNNSGSAGERAYTAIIQNVFDFIRRNYVDEVDSQTLFEGAMKGMFDSLNDPHSSFLPSREMEDLNDTTSGRFGGVGLFISKPLDTKPDGTPPFVEVTSPIEDTPGWRAGINPGDLIVEINGEPTDVISMDTVLSRLRGVPGTDVTLLIRRGAGLEFPVVLTRAVIEVPVIKYDMIGDTGYVRIISFTPMTVTRTREALDSFKAKNYKSLVVDLRNNPGGLLEAAVGVCELFLDGGMIVSTKSRIPGENHEYKAGRRIVVPKEMPVIVLINRGSASASEIVAGALKDRGRAYLVGEKTYGKGSVQKVYPVGNHEGFRLTTARYYTPSDVNIDKIGIPPDKEIQLYPDFSAADAEKFKSLISSNKIPAFVKENPKASAAQINAFARELNSQFGLDINLLRRLIRNEQTRTVIAPVYDLEYDTQLEEAVKILRSGNYNQLMKSSKTLKALQEEAEEALPLAS